MAKNEYKMEIKGGKVAFPVQGGNQTFNNTIGFQENYGTTDGRDPKSAKDEDPLISLLRKLLESRQEKYLKVLKDSTEPDELEVILRHDVNHNDILPFRKLIYGIALVGTPDSNGTAFLADVPDLGTCLLSSGHNFGSLFKAPDNKIMDELNKVTAWFGNSDGIIPDRNPSDKLEKGKPMNLRLFLEKFGCYGSSCFDGKRLVFRKRSNVIETTSEDIEDEQKDYFAILLKDEIKDKVDELGIDILNCGHGQDIKYKEGSVATLVGHPGHEEWKSMPLCLSYGKEIGENRTFLHFNYDSLPGNSGSPVFGRGYKVKGIHTSGLRGKRNSAHKITDVADWINLGK